MILNNTKDKQKGFTIVELLVVIVVIGILAAITIVSYVGITAKANLTKTQGNLDSISQVIDMLGSEGTTYPITSATVNAGGTYAKMPAGVTVKATAPASKDEYQFFTCGSTGAKLVYWDSVTNAVSTNITYLGAATSTSTCTAA